MFSESAGYHKMLFQIRSAPIKITYSDQQKSLRKYLFIWGLSTIILLLYSAGIYLNYISIKQFSLLVSSYVLSNGIYSLVLSIYTFLLCNLQLRYNVLNRNMKYMSQNRSGILTFLMFFFLNRFQIFTCFTPDKYKNVW